MENLTPNLKVCIVLEENLDEMLINMKANFIVKCKVLEKGDSHVLHPSGYYIDEDLINSDRKDNYYAQAYITTPYTMQIEEVYHGNVNKEGEIITVNAPYGIIGEFYNKPDGHPVYETGEEYIMVFRVDRWLGVNDYFLAYSPASCLKLKDNGKSFDTKPMSIAETIYKDFNNDTEKLADRLKEFSESGKLKTTLTSIEKNGDGYIAVELEP